jgi:hypothetical protein
VLAFDSMTNSTDTKCKDVSPPNQTGRTDPTARAVRPWLVSLTLHTLGMLFLALWVAPSLRSVPIERLKASLGGNDGGLAEFSLAAPSQPEFAVEASAFDSSAVVTTDLVLPKPVQFDSAAFRPVKPINFSRLSVDVPAAQKLTEAMATSRTASAIGELRRADGVDGATDVVTRAISRELELGDTLVVWLLDASISLSQNREVLANKAAAFYKSTDSFNTSPDQYSGQHTLMSSVVAFGRRSSEVLPSTRMGAKAVEAMTRVPIDMSGIENVMAAVSRTVRLYRKTKRRKERIVLVVLTDESGDDLLQLEPTIELCRQEKVAVHVVGPSAVMGCQKGSQLCVLTNNNVDYSFWLTVNKGPETSLPERFLVPYWHESSVPPWRQGGASASLSEWYGGSYRERVPSGFGPYALTRLALQTGGSFTIFEQLPAQADYDLEHLLQYAPDYGSTRDYRDSIEGKPLRQFIADAAAISFKQPELFTAPRMVFMGARSPYYPYKVEQHYYSPADFRDQLSVAVLRERRRVTQASQVLAQFVAHLIDPSIDWEYEYAREESKRWRAWYDLTRGRLLATQARYLEYLATTSQFGGVLSTQCNEVTLHAASALGNPESELLINDAMRCLYRCVSENEGTPWEDLARWELDIPCGLRVEQGTIPRPKPRISSGSPRAPQQFSFPNL